MAGALFAIRRKASGILPNLHKVKKKTECLVVRVLVMFKVAKMSKTYNSGYSLVVTHLTTNPPVRCLNRAERTGSLVFNVLWSYVN
jgi:hypothetical protein